MITEAVGNILKRKEIQELLAVPASASVADAVAMMSSKGIGAIIVRNPGGPV